MPNLKLYMGWDEREQEAYRVACRSLARVSDLIPIPLKIDRLTDHGLLRRPMDRRGNMYDIVSNAPCATEFAASRFLTPMLAQTGWALFVDCDVVFMADPSELLELADPSKAVMVVKHHNGHQAGTKMDGQQQMIYPRKNWSSVVLWNCDHPGNRRLSLRDVNERPGRDLHAFYHLHDEEIGELPDRWNWLVNVNEMPASPAIAHFTLGGPWLPTWKGAEHDDIWLRAANG